MKEKFSLHKSSEKERSETENRYSDVDGFHLPQQWVLTRCGGAHMGPADERLQTQLMSDVSCRVNSWEGEGGVSCEVCIFWRYFELKLLHVVFLYWTTHAKKKQVRFRLYCIKKQAKFFVFLKNIIYYLPINSASSIQARFYRVISSLNSLLMDKFR